MILFGTKTLKYAAGIRFQSWWRKKDGKKWHNNFHVIGGVYLFVDYNYVQFCENVITATVKMRGKGINVEQRNG